MSDNNKKLCVLHNLVLRLCITKSEYELKQIINNPLDNLEFYTKKGLVAISKKYKIKKAYNLTRGKLINKLRNKNNIQEEIQPEEQAEIQSEEQTEMTKKMINIEIKLKSKTVKEIKTYAKNKQIKIPSKYTKKNDIIKFIQNFLTNISNEQEEIPQKFIPKIEEIEEINWDDLSEEKLNKRTIKELKEYCKRKKIIIRSTLKKKEIINTIIKHKNTINPDNELNQEYSNPEQSDLEQSDLEQSDPEQSDPEQSDPEQSDLERSDIYLSDED